MATSAIRFKDHDVYIRDSHLGEVIRAITLASSDLMAKNPDAAQWLLEACAWWSNDYETMPPGLKDIELDNWLSSEERLTTFKMLVSKLCADSVNDKFDAKIVTKELNKVLTLLAEEQIENIEAH